MSRNAFWFKIVFRCSGKSTCAPTSVRISLNAAVEITDHEMTTDLSPYPLRLWGGGGADYYVCV